MTHSAGSQGGTDVLKGLNKGTGIPFPQLFNGREERRERDKQIKLSGFLQSGITLSLEESQAISLNFQTQSCQATMLYSVYPPDEISFSLTAP